MNYEWMVERILAFHRTCDAVTGVPADPWAEGPELSGDALVSKYYGELPTFLKIAKALEVALPSSVSTRLDYQAAAYRQVAQVAVGVARDAKLVKKNLAPDAPAVGADQFHPHVWSAAEPLWGTGNFRVAAGAAATSLSAHIAQKAGSTLADRDLVQEVFAPRTAPGRPRLHFPGDPTSDTWRSRQDGLHLTAQGAFAGIRNVAAHSNEEWPEQEALEMLGVLSVIARWTDETELRLDPTPQ
ncbi:TIGR02391 family protein [Kribbella sp. NPDC051587]|uniref:TIGR02391 family protein n=1 Tax=Kribbella sp. NPDC051587 TaxID=3364119 RepID=UPI00379B899B